MNKKIILAGLLSLASIASVVGTVGNAHKVDAANLDANTYVYFELPSTWDKTKTTSIMIGHDSWSQCYAMTNIANTDVYYVSMPKWDGYTQYGFMSANGAAWGGEGSAPKDRIQWALNKTNICYAAGLALNSKYNLFGGSATDPYAFTTKGANVSALNFAVSANAETGGTASVTGYELTSATAVTSKSGESINVLKFTDITLTATVDEGYEFVGWYEGATLVSNEATCTVRDITGAKTYTAKFNPVVTSNPNEEVNALFAKYYKEGSYTKDSILNTSKIADEEVAKYFHASADTKFRKTVYTPTGLTMTTSTDGVTYGNESKYEDSEGKVVHTGLGGNYTVNKESVEAWFVTLKDFVDASGEGWTVADGVYTHELVAATETEEAELTRMAREFVAPMWLAPNANNYAYAQFTRLTVEEVSETLVMKLYVDNGDILVEGSNNVFSQVTIY